LLSFIDSILDRENVNFRSFADIFAGTGVVANHFHSRTDVVLNDILESNYQIYLAFFGKERLRLGLLHKKLSEYNEIGTNQLPHNYFSKNFANTYFDLGNSKRIGHIREDIEQLFLNKEISKREKAYLLTSLMYAMDRIANTVGHYDAYRKIKIPNKLLNLRPLELRNRKYRALIHKQDANELVKKIKADVVYIDPPYNSRQYSDTYHLLENIADWKKEHVYGIAKKIGREHLKSKYSLKSAGNAFSELINNIDAKFILISYNDMGTRGNVRSQSRISDHEIISALERRGSVKIYEKDFNQFTTGRSNNGDLKERIFFCRVENKNALKPAIVHSERNTHLPEYVKSPLNYTGGKHKLLPQLTKFFPENIDTFYDVFCGGANVGINAQARRVICIDNNPYVIELLRLVKTSNFEELNQSILSVIGKYKLSQSYINGYQVYNAESTSGLGGYNKEAYLALRKAFNDKEPKDAVLLLVLILYSFNNQIRFNSQGYFNLPVGKRDYNGSSRKNLAFFNAITNTKNIAFNHGDFRDLKNTDFSRSDFVYLDPPYLLGLASYNESGGWTLGEELELYSTLEDLHRRGVRFALSNVLEHKGQKNTGLKKWIKENGFTAHIIESDYKNSNYQSTAKNGLTKEILVTNY